MPIIHVNNADLYYRESGTGNKYIVSGHMHIYDSDNYRLELVALGYHVIEVELRGYGRSTHVTEDLGVAWYDVWAADCCAVAKALGAEKFVYTGLSHGAGVGWHISKNTPQVLLGFVGLVAGPHKKDGAETGAARQSTIDAASSEEKWLAHCNGFHAADEKDFVPDMTSQEREALQRWHKEKYDCYLNMAYEERIVSPKKPFPTITTEEELMEVIGNMNAPALFIGGMNDPISTPECMLRTAHAYQGSKTVLYNYGTHATGAQYAGRVARDIDLFLREEKVFQ